MDSLLTSGARLLAAGDPLGALKRIALRDDAPALALRGIAMAQLGDYARARALLRRAALRFGARERLSRARCQIAEAEVALVSRDLGSALKHLEPAAKILASRGDHVNALHAQLIRARFHLLTGDVAAAEGALARIEDGSNGLGPAIAARAELTRAEVALRRIHVSHSKRALERAATFATVAGIPALVAEVDHLRSVLSAPSARLIRGGVVKVLRLAQVEELFASGDLVVDGCRREIRDAQGTVRLAGRPILFVLARALAEAWPADVGREQLILRAFEARQPHASHRSRLRVELGRLRAIVRRLARIEATAGGFRLVPLRAPAATVLAPPIDGPAGALLALLSDGEAWSTSALARALGASQRTLQRTLQQLHDTAAVRRVGRGRSGRWLAASLSGFAPTLLLPGSLRLG